MFTSLTATTATVLSFPNRPTVDPTPRAGSREEARLAGAVSDLEECVMTMTITLGTHTAGSVG